MSSFGYGCALVVHQSGPLGYSFDATGFLCLFPRWKKKKNDGDHVIMVYTIISRSPPLSRHHAINTSLILILELLTSKTLLITTSNLLSYHRRRLNITSLLLKWLSPFSFCILAQEHLQIIAAEDYETAV